MRISDWSSDACSSDLHFPRRSRRHIAPRPRPDRRPDRGAAPSAAGGGRLKAGVRKFGTDDRRLLPEGRLSGPMPWVIAIMMLLTVLAAATGLGLRHAAESLGETAGSRENGRAHV